MTQSHLKERRSKEVGAVVSERVGVMGHMFLEIIEVELQLLWKM